MIPKLVDIAETTQILLHISHFVRYKFFSFTLTNYLLLIQKFDYIIALTR